MLSDRLGETTWPRRAWNEAKRRLPDLGNLPHTVGWTETRGRRYLEGRDPSLRQRRVILSANPGRAGSALLAELLGSVPGVVAAHEPRPRMTGGILEVATGRPLAETRGLRAVKIRAMDRVLSGMAPDAVYAETTNMFIKTFHDVVLEAFDEVDVVALRRPAEELLKSYLELAWFDPRNATWPDWLADPVGPNRAVPPLWELEGRPLPVEDPVERILAYLVDTEGRIDRLQARLPATRFHSVTLSELSGEAGRRSLLTSLRLEPGAVGDSPARTNVRKGWKAFYALGAAPSLPECGRRVEEYLGRMRSMGVDLPVEVRNW